MPSFSVHKLPKLEKYLMCGSLIAVFAAILYISFVYTITPAGPINQLGLTTASSQIVKSWNFNESQEGWRGYNTSFLQSKNGILYVKPGQYPANSNIQNREVQAYLPLPLKYLSFNMAIQKNTVNTSSANSYFTFYIYYKKQGSDSWFGPRTLYGKVSPLFSEYITRIPVLNPLTIRELKVVFAKGITAGDTVQFDSIRIINQPQPTVTPVNYLYKPSPTRYYYPSPTRYYYPTPTPAVRINYPSCYPPPPCYYGVRNPAGDMYYCLPAYEGQWCIN